MTAALTPGSTFDVVIEIPRGSRNKYEYDHEQHVIRLDRRLFSATVYPSDYGFVPDTLALDGDPLDVLVLLEDPTFPGVWVEAKPVGLLWMQDEAGPDAKVICVPPAEPRWRGVEDLKDLPDELLEEIKHFFDVYKALEPGKYATTAGFENRTGYNASISDAQLKKQLIERPTTYLLGQVDTLPLGAAVFSALVEQFELGTLHVSSGGLREGMLLRELGRVRGAGAVVAAPARDAQLASAPAWGL